MQEFSLAFGRVSHSAIAANSELKAHVVDLLARAYHNIHGQSLSSADPAWIASITAASMQLSLDDRVRGLSPRETIQLFENVIRISEEHQREARRHIAMSSNVFYLKETAIDAVAISSAESFYQAAAPMVLGGGSNVAHSGRLEAPKIGEPIA
jgi:hypothetical protein